MEPFWERSEVVEQFASRPAGPPVGPAGRGVCAAGSDQRARSWVRGRGNTVLLAEQGFYVWAVDAFVAMVERTRERVAAVLGPEQARERVQLGRMGDLSSFADPRFDLVVALGVYHGAASRAEWERAMAETARVLKPGGEYWSTLHTGGGPDR